MRTPYTRSPKGAGLTEYSLVAALIAVVTIVAVIFLGDAARLPLCVSESNISEEFYDAQRAPCAEIPPPATPIVTPPSGPVFETFVVDSELPGFFNPTGPAMGVEALASGSPILGQPTEQQIFNALCVALGHLGPASSVTTTTVDTAGAYFLTGGRWVWTGVSETWSHDAGLPPYNILDGATPIIQSLSCRRIVP